MNDNFVVTLANLHLATEQQVFDQVVRHLLTQGKRSADMEGRCVYRGENGLKCATGALIGDDEYREEFEHNTWGCLCQSGAVSLEHRGLIHDLQQIHDYIDDSKWEKWFESIAKRYKLSTTVISEFK